MNTAQEANIHQLHPVLSDLVNTRFCNRKVARPYRAYSQSPY